MSSPLDTTESAARARILWGEQPERVRADLLAAGWTLEEVNAVIDEAARNRRMEIRQRAWKRVASGTVILAVGVSLLILVVTSESGISARAGGGPMFLVFWGAWRSLNGIMKLLLPGGDRTCITEMDAA